MKANATQNGALRRENNANTAQSNSDFSANQSDSEIDNTSSPAFKNRPLSSVEATTSVSTWQKIRQAFDKACEATISFVKMCAVVALGAIGCTILFSFLNTIFRFAVWCQMHAMLVTFLLTGETAVIVTLLIVLTSNARKLNKLTNEHRDLLHQQLTDVSGRKII